MGPFLDKKNPMSTRRRRPRPKKGAVSRLAVIGPKIKGVWGEDLWERLFLSRKRLRKRPHLGAKKWKRGEKKPLARKETIGFEKKGRTVAIQFKKKMNHPLPLAEKKRKATRKKGEKETPIGKGGGKGVPGNCCNKRLLNCRKRSLQERVRTTGGKMAGIVWSRGKEGRAWVRRKFLAEKRKKRHLGASSGVPWDFSAFDRNKKKILEGRKRSPR